MRAMIRGGVSRFWAGGVRTRPDNARICAAAPAARTTDRSMATQSQKALTEQNINPNIVKLEYAVRGPLVIRAGEIEKELEKVCDNRILHILYLTNHLPSSVSGIWQKCQ